LIGATGLPGLRRWTRTTRLAPAGDWPDARAIRGGEAGWNFYLDVAQILSLGRAHVEFVDAGGDKVLGHQRQAGRGQRSGADVEVDYWRVITFRDGKILRDEWFTDRAEALEAAGLSE
jgi:ketosteroid isomerase-like protein